MTNATHIDSCTHACTYAHMIKPPCTRSLVQGHEICDQCQRYTPPDGTTHNHLKGAAGVPSQTNGLQQCSGIHQILVSVSLHSFPGVSSNCASPRAAHFHQRMQPSVRIYDPLLSALHGGIEPATTHHVITWNSRVTCNFETTMASC
jgi:hypothetical protein